jgi:DNA uptake protein ComE-like DNA-binding protein
MNKKCSALVSKIWFLFLYTAVITSLIMVISTVSFAAKKAAKGSAAIININTADEKAIESLPGIGKATAIIEGRPYKSIRGYVCAESA